MNSLQKKVLGIVGSPRRNGNTETLIDEVLAGAEKSGAKIEKIILNEMNINPCQACNTCYKTNQCVQQDDMVKIFEKMKASQVWVFGTPIYWWGPTAQFKIFLDRWYGAKGVSFKGKQAILVIPLGGGHPRYARHTVGLLTDVFNYLKIELFETILATGVNRKGIIRDNSDIMSKAFNAGREIIGKKREIQ